jgi:hypothetical protein
MERDVKSWLSKLEQVKNGSVDLSIDEDLSIALMNLISLEEHFYFTAMKTNDNNYLEMLKPIRELRKKLLAKIVKNPKGEEWCISKHLLASSMRLVEVGTKELARNNKEEANEYFTSAFDLYSLFFGINLKMIEAETIKIPQNQGRMSEGVLSRFSLMVKRIVDCCKE